VAFYYRPDWIKWGLRTATHGIEAVGDALPSPWGDRIEIVLRELGGFIWIQITVLIIFIRVVFSSIATGWRYRRREYLKPPSTDGWRAESTQTELRHKRNPGPVSRLLTDEKRSF